MFVITTHICTCAVYRGLPGTMPHLNFTGMQVVILESIFEMKNLKFRDV